MLHQEPDRFARESRLIWIDPRVKILTLFVMLVVVVMLRRIDTLLLALGISIGLLLFSGVPVSHILRQFSLSLPFIAFAALSLYWTSGTVQAEGMFLRISTAVLLLLVLSSTTPFFELLRGLQALRVPGIYIEMLLFVHHYIHVFGEELERMEQAKKARGFTGKGNILNRHIVNGVVSTAGMLLVRSYERGSRFHYSLQSRGFQGEIKTVHPLTLHRGDAAFSVLILALTFCLAFLEFGGAA